MKNFILAIFTIAMAVSFNRESKAQSKLFFEKIYLHTDRETFVPGEDVWFSAYLVNGQNNNFINSSNTLYTELVRNDKSQEVVLKQIIRIEQGRAAGNFKLNDSIPTGTYTIRAWTNWMRNFGDFFIFEKQIQILGKDDAQKNTLAGNTKPSTNLKETKNSTTYKVNRTENIQFLPEGGSLIDSVGSLLAFKAVDASGKSLGFDAEIKNSKGELISGIKSESGIGVVFFTPLPNEVYTAKGRYTNGNSFETNLPKALRTGFALRVTNKDSVLNVVVSSNGKTPTNGKQALLAVKSRGKVYFNIQFDLASPQVLVQVPKDQLPEGVNAITLYDEKGKPNCERLVYIDKADRPLINISTEKSIYSTNEKTTVQLKVTDSQNKPLKTSLSVATIDAGLVKPNEGNIVSYLMLQSELMGKIENPKQYFDTKNANRIKQLDLLLLTQGWRDFVWRRLADTTVKITQVAESGITVTGKVKQVLSEKPIGNSNVSMFANGAKGDKLFGGRTDSAGVYQLDGLELYGQQKLKLTSATDKGKKNGWITLDSLFKDTKIKPFVPEVAPIVQKPLVEELTKRLKVMKNASLRDTIHLNEVRVVDRNVSLFDRVVGDFGYPVEDYTVTKADYDYYSLKSFLMHKSGGIREIDNPNNPGESFLAYPVFNGFVQPRIVVNNKELPFTDYDPQSVKNDYYNTYWSLAMSKVERVVIKHLVGIAPQINQSPNLNTEEGETATAENSRPGDDVYIIYLTLKSGALDKKIFNSIVEDVTGYYQAKSFYNTQIMGLQQSNDQRTTINWVPLVITNENGEATVSYNNSGLKSKVNVFVEGLTSAGNPVAGSLTYEVK